MTVVVTTEPETVTVTKLHSVEVEVGGTACTTVELLGAGAARTCFKGAEEADDEMTDADGAAT